MSTSLIRNNKPAPRLIDMPIQPELIATSPQTLLSATIKLLREHLPSHEFKIEQVTGHEAIISHRKGVKLDFYRLKISR
jgi:hypothetical protein